MSEANDLPTHLRAHANRYVAADPIAAVNMQFAKDVCEAAAALERVQWRDIVTAPEDFETFHAWIVADDGCEWFERDCYIDEDGVIRDHHGDIVNDAHKRATHWMPQLSAPTLAIEG